MCLNPMLWIQEQLANGYHKVNSAGPFVGPAHLHACGVWLQEQALGVFYLDDYAASYVI